MYGTPTMCRVLLFLLYIPFHNDLMRERFVSSIFYVRKQRFAGIDLSSLTQTCPSGRIESFDFFLQTTVSM